MKISMNIMAATLRERPSNDAFNVIKDELKLCVKTKQWSQLQEDISQKHTREEAVQMHETLRELMR